MRSRRRVAALALLLAGATGGRAAPPGRPCGTAEACFARFTEGQRGVLAVRAQFRQVKEIALLEEPLESRGRFTYERGGGVRWEVEEPERMIVEIDESRLRAGPPGAVAEVAVGSAGHVLEEMAGLFAGTASADAFELASGSTPGSVRLRPRDPSVARVVESIEIGFDAEVTTPRWVRIDEVGGDRTRIEMSDVRVERDPERSP